MAVKTSKRGFWQFGAGRRADSQVADYHHARFSMSVAVI